MIDETNELILRLEPAWGTNKAEKLKLIHAIGDDERKERLERILNLSASKLLGDSLLNNHIMLPPSNQKECSLGEITLGQVCYGRNLGKDKALYPLRLSLNELRNHAILDGMSGSGKTSLAYNMALQLAQHGTSIIVFDWNRTWRNLLTLSELENPIIKDIRVYTVGRDIAPFRYNIFFSPPEGISLQNWLATVVGSPLERSLLAGMGVENLILNEAESLMQAYQEGKLRLLPNVEDIKKGVEKQFLRGRTALWQQSAIRVLTELCRPQNKRVFSSRNPMNLAKEIIERKGITILELDLPTHLRILFQETFITYYMLHQLQRGETHEGLRNVLILEEFQNMLPQSKIEKQVGGEIIRNLFKESRKFSTGIIALAQEPSELGNYVYANCLTQIHFATTTYKDISTVSNGLFLKPHQIAYIDYLWRGDAIVKIKGRTKNCHLKTPLPPKTRQLSDEELAEFVKKWKG